MIVAALPMLLAGLLVMPNAALSADSPAPTLTVVAFGDSLTAGYLLQPNESFPAQLQMALEAKGHKVQIVNAGVSGDTTAGGLDRLAWTLQPIPDAVILELGANDALRGTDPAKTRANLDQILTTLSASNIPVLLAGMKAPGNWGDAYVKAFDAIYPELAAKHGAALYPFFLEGVALNPKLVLADGMHPTAEGVAEIVKRILPNVEALIAKAQAHKAAAKN
ncbi:MAG: arylesterase [Hyphomicrobium sp.]|nr:arylesterase [Hyphomicrobium sp.]